MAARCNGTLFKPGFDLSTVQYAATDVGTLYDAQCELCSAQLFKGEVMASSAAGRKRGRSCCSDGAVQLPEVSKLPRLEVLLWRDRSDPNESESAA